MRTAGTALFDHLLGIYVSGRHMTAKDFAIGRHYCDIAGVGGAHWKWWGVSPGKPSGRYRDHVDRRLPPIGPMMKVRIPMA
eukprot:5389885-Pyramimonas_sp.AAC.1